MAEEMKNPESPLAKSPQDFALFELGAFDEESGKFENLESPRQLIRAQDIKERSS